MFNMPIHAGGSTAQKNMPRNPLHRIILTLACIVAAVSIPYPAALGFGLSAFLLFMLWCGIPFRFIVGRMLLVLPFGFFAVAFLPFLTEGEPVLRVFGLAVSDEGLDKATLILLKIGCANIMLTYLIATTPLFDLIKGLRAIGVPAVLIELISMMMRYFFLLSEETKGMLKAQRSRGFSTKGWFWSRRTYRRFGQLLGVLFIRAYSRSQRIYLSMSSRGGFDFEKVLSEDVFATAEARRSSMAIEVKGVSYHYGPVRALKDISFAVARGSKVALMGPNGAGKSTLISLLNGLEEPGAGEIRIFGVTVDRSNRELLRRKLGVVYQDPDDQIFSTTVEEDVAFGPRNLGLSEEEVEERVFAALGSVGMRDARKRSPFELSYGQKRRVAIAGVLAMQPEVLVLDEPMAFLDPKSRDDLQSLLEGIHMMGMTIMIATHDVDFAAEWADTVVILKEGRLLCSGSTDVLFDDALIREADLHLPRLARPFRLLGGIEGACVGGSGRAGASTGVIAGVSGGSDGTGGSGNLNPKTVKQAAQMIWRLLMRKDELQQKAEERQKRTGAP